MATFVKFNAFIQGLGTGVYDLDTDVLQVYLTDTAPDIETSAVKADLPDIAHGNGYTGPIDLQNAYAATGAVGVVTGTAAISVSAVGGPIGPFRFVVIFDSTPAAGPLVGFADYGSEFTIDDNGTFTIDFQPEIMTIQ